MWRGKSHAMGVEALRAHPGFRHSIQSLLHSFHLGFRWNRHKAEVVRLRLTWSFCYSLAAGEHAPENSLPKPRSMRDAHAQQTMREIAVKYERLAQQVEQQTGGAA